MYKYWIKRIHVMGCNIVVHSVYIVCVAVAIHAVIWLLIHNDGNVMVYSVVHIIAVLCIYV